MNALTMAGSENCLPIGTRLADFEITGILGEGGFGIVYIAFDHSLQRNVAIKEYMPGVLAARAEDHSIRVRAERHQETFNVGLKSFINEARFLAQFDHPSLVKVYRFWEQNQTAYTAMQYYDGRTIKDIVNGSPELVTEEWCRKVLKQILEALEMLYTMRILHRDVSPDNIIVQENGDAVLLDFGSARQIIGDRTRGLTVILKPGYAPVEQYAGDASLDQGAYTDIYALSAVIYFAIMKEAPATSIARMVKDPIPPLAERGVQGYSREFLAALDKGLAVMANERPQTIDAFRELLGIPSSGAPKARNVGDTQRFATLRKLPEPGAPVTGRPVTGAPAGSPAVPPHSGATVKDAAVKKDKTAKPAKPQAKAQAKPRSAMHANAPRWASRLALVVAILAIAGWGAKWLLDTPTENMVVSETPAAPSTPLPDAAAALPAPAPAPVEAVPAPVDPVPPTADAAAVAATPAAPEVGADGLPLAGDKPVAAKNSSYRLSVKPWGTVYVDGKEEGVSPPLKRLSLPAGKHKIRVVNPNFPDYSVDVNVVAGKSGTIDYDFAAHSK